MSDFPRCFNKLMPVKVTNFLSGASIADGTPERWPATSKKGEAEAWVGIFKNKTPKALMRRRTAHPRRSGGRAPRQTRIKEPKRKQVGADGVCGCGARDSGPGSSRRPAECPPKHQRASDGATRAGAPVGFRRSRTRHPLARGVTERSFAELTGWPLLHRQASRGNYRKIVNHFQITL